MATGTTLKLPSALKSRVARLAKKTGRTSHGFMVDPIARGTVRQERMEAFAREALAADRTIDETGEVYAAEDVHGWLSRLAAGKRARRPRQWRR